MKKIAILLMTVITVSSVFAQQSKVVTAYRYLKDFGDSKDVESLNKAKEAIDLANAHPDTKDLAKTQVYRAQIYQTIFENNLRTQTEMIKDVNDPNKKTLIGYQNTSIQELSTAYSAYTSAKAKDEKGSYKDEISNGITRIASYYENKAIADYSAKKFADALPSFEMSYEIKGEKDTATLSNCALVADRAGVNDKAKLYYQKMIDAKVGGASSYSTLINVMMRMKDSLNATELLKKGRIAYPHDINLLLKETDMYIQAHKSVEALENLNKAIVAKPNDNVLYFARGNTYDNLANPKDATGKELEKPADYDVKLMLAEDDYKKAIELKKDYFDALYNLGVLYNNHGVALNKAADKIQDQKLYDAANAKSIAEFNKAMPQLEKALEINEKDRNTMIALKQIYARLGDTAKLAAINERLKK